MQDSILKQNSLDICARNQANKQIKKSSHRFIADSKRGGSRRVRKTGRKQSDWKEFMSKKLKLI